MDNIIVSLYPKDRLKDNLSIKQSVDNSPLNLILDSDEKVIGVSIDKPAFLLDEKGDKIDIEVTEDSLSFEQLLSELGLEPFNSNQNMEDEDV